MDRRALAMLLVALAVAPCARPQEKTASASSEPSQTIVSPTDISLDPPEGVSFFRFLPGGQWSDFDRPLLICAAQGEERSYRIELGRRTAPSAATDSAQGANGSGVAGGEFRSYLIDKRPPEPPTATPADGLFRAALSPSLSAEPGCSIYWALVGAGSSEGFRQLGTGPGPSMAPPLAGTASYTLIAYAVDAAGNQSRLARFAYLLAQGGLPAAAPQAAAPPPAASADASLGPPQTVEEEGSVELVAFAPAGSVFLVDVNPAAPPRSLDDFVQVEAEGGRASFRIPCPYGWKGSLPVYYGFLTNDVLRFNPTPLDAALAWEPEASAEPPAPLAPVIVADPIGRGAYLSFPRYDGTIYVSVDGSPERSYSGPFALSSASPRVRVSWLGEDGRGRRSAPSESFLDLPPRAPEISIVGVQEGAKVGRDLSLAQSAPGVLRYEIGSVDDPPAEPSASSPILSGTLAVTCPAGQKRQVLIRYRSYLGAASDSVGGEERTLSFTIDKVPPPAPSLLESSQPYSDKPVSLSFAAEGEGVAIYASVAVGGATAPFAEVNGPIELAGAETGPVSYLLRAYAVDELGNRSAEMRPVTVVVDKDSVYAAEGAAAGGDGSPARPFASLDSALNAAVAGNKKSVYLRGSLTLGSAFQSGRDLSLVGGFSDDWSRDSSQKATISVTVPPAGAALAVKASRLTLRGVDVRATGAGGPLISATEGGLLEIVDSSLSSTSAGDSIIVKVASSSLSVEGSTLSADAAMSCTAVDASDSAVTLSDSVVGARSSVHAFGACVLSGGSLTIARSLFKSSADLALRLLDLRGARLSMERSLVQVEGGSGYMRIGSFVNSPGEVRDCKFDVAWQGDGTLFELSGEGPAFRYDTLLASARGGALRYFDLNGASLQVWNSILSCEAGGQDLVHTDGPLGAGSLVADCIWGFPTLVDGAMDIAKLDALDALNAASPIFSSKRHVSEPPQATFAAPEKSVAPLSPRSACVGAALPIDEGPAVDFLGHPRPGLAGPAAPDIGAQELSE